MHCVSSLQMVWTDVREWTSSRPVSLVYSQAVGCPPGIVAHCNQMTHSNLQLAHAYSQSSSVSVAGPGASLPEEPPSIFSIRAFNFAASFAASSPSFLLHSSQQGASK